MRALQVVGQTIEVTGATIQRTLNVIDIISNTGEIYANELRKDANADSQRNDKQRSADLEYDLKKIDIKHSKRMAELEK